MGRRPESARIETGGDGASYYSAATNSERRAPPWTDVLLIAVFGAIAVYLLVVGLRLRVDYFDAYQNLLNARAILHRDPTDYSIYRGIFYPVLILPATAVGQLFRSADLTFLLAHLTAFVMYALLVFTSYKLFRLYLRRTAALLGATLLAGNLLIVNSAPMIKEDIPGTAFLTGAVYLYLRGRPTGLSRDLIGAGLLIAAASGLRYQLLPLALVLIAVVELGRPFFGAQPDPRPQAGDGNTRVKVALYLGVLPVAALLLMPLVLYPLLGRSSPVAAPRLFLHDLNAVRLAVAVDQGWAQNYRFVIESFGLLTIGALAGAIYASLKRRDAGLVFGSWLVIFFVAQTYLIGHKEARFLFPIFPPLYFFIALAVEALSDQIGRRLNGRPRPEAAAGAVLVLLLGVAATWTVPALARFQDRVYLSDYEASLSRYAAGLATGSSIRWVGPPYPLHPRDFRFDPDDAFTYLYHAYSPVASFWTGRSVPAFASTQFLAVGAVAYPDQGMCALLRPDDVLIANREPAGYESRNVPGRLRPLVVERAAVVRFDALPGRLLEEFESNAGNIVVRRQSDSYRLVGRVRSDGTYELSLGGNGSPALAIRDSLVEVRQGQFELTVSAEVWEAGGARDSLSLISFQEARQFPPPGQP